MADLNSMDAYHLGSKSNSWLVLKTYSVPRTYKIQLQNIHSIMLEKT